MRKSPLRIVITGASGFIGSHLAAEARRQGHEVVALSRRASEECRWSLGKPLPIAAQRGIDCAVHLAHDFDGEGGARRTVEGTCAALDSLRTAGVRRQLYFSSLSARLDATSLYGRTKLEVEQRVAVAGDVAIVRPGLVLGEGGLYGRIRNWVRDWPVVPLPDGGWGKVSVIEIESLCRQVLRIATWDTDEREFNLFEPAPRRLRDLVLCESRQAGKRILIIPIPSRPLLFALALAERLKLSPPVKADNLAGFLANQSAYHRPTPVVPI